MRVPSPNEGTRRATGLVRAHILPSRVACVVHGVPLWSCQCSGTFTRRWCCAGMARVEHAFRRFWRPAPWPLGHPYAYEKPPVRFPCERLLAGTGSFLSRSLRHPQNARRSQGRGYAGIPFVLLVTDCPEFHRCSFHLACCLLSRVPVGNRYRNGLFPDAGSSSSRRDRDGLPQSALGVG